MLALTGSLVSPSCLMTLQESLHQKLVKTYNSLSQMSFEVKKDGSC